ncbi:MAG: PilZ domain-containing protein [Bacillota bacterium]|nr:PilZ domain-containing protein [Bacillota bacterium]
MDSLSDKYISCPCEIKTFDNYPVTFGVLSKIMDDRLVIDKLHDKLPIIHCETIVKISVYNSSLGLQVLIGNVFLSTPDIMHIINIKTVAGFEKRNYYRIRVIMEAAAELMSADPVKRIPLKSFNVQVFNLSISGAAFSSPLKLRVNDNIRVNLPIFRMNIALNSKVRRVIKPFSDGVGEFGIKFVENRGKEIDLLSKYIVEYQREQIRAMKESVTLRSE